MDLLQEEAAKQDLSLRRIFDLLGEEGHAILMLVLCLPFLQPLPMPGLSTPLGILIGLVAVFLFLRRPPWLPKKFENLQISAEVVIRISEVAERIWTYASRVVKERWTIFYNHPLFRILNLLLVLMNAIFLSLPLPIPFSNTVPAVGIILTAIGSMEKDGLFLLASYFWCLVVLSFFSALIAGVYHIA
jgi:hypothetical protein